MRSTPSSTCSRPPSITTVRASVRLDAWLAMITAMATAMGAVGPDIWDRVPPNTAAKKPTAIAPYRPAAAPSPDATPKASDTGNATTVEVIPPKRSPRNVSRSGSSGTRVEGWSPDDPDREEIEAAETPSRGA